MALERSIWIQRSKASQWASVFGRLLDEGRSAQEQARERYTF